MANGYKKIDLQNLPASAAEFIRLVIKKMRYRKKVQRDVQAELAAHFEDELKDCRTDEEKEQKAGQLIEEFGDVKLLGILLRRAKKRCRPLWRTIVARTFQTVGVLILCFIVYTAWFFSGKPAISVDYLALLNQMNRSQVLDEDNAWPHYEKAIELYVEASEELKEMDIFEDYKEIRSFAELTKEEKQEIKKWVQRNQPAWQEFVEGSLKPYCYREYDSKSKMLLAIPFPHLAPLKGLSKLGIWRSRMEIEQNQTQQGLEDCLILIRTASHWQGKGTLIEQFVGPAISGLVSEEILYIAATQKLSAADLNQLQQELLRIYPEGYLPTVNIEGERLMFLDMVQKTFTEGGPGGGHLIPKELFLSSEHTVHGPGDAPAIVGYTAASMVHVRRDETIAKAKEIYDRISDTVKMSPYERHIGNVKTAEDILMSMSKYRYFLFHFLVPATGRVSEIAYRGKSQYEALLTILALQRWQLEKGGYPENLEQLVTSGYLKELPMDPWSDKPLVYKKTDDNFILYSIGHNFTDDGGKVARNKKGKVKRWVGVGDEVFWPVSSSEVRKEK